MSIKNPFRDYMSYRYMPKNRLKNRHPDKKYVGESNPFRNIIMPCTANGYANI